MSLNWDLTGIKDYKTLCWVETGEVDKETGKKLKRLNPVTDALIWYTMVLELRLTEENLLEFITRMRLSDKEGGAMLQNQQGDRPLTVEEVRAHIGLKTNVCDEKASTWLKKRAARRYCDAFHAVREELKVNAKCPVDPYSPAWGGRR